MASSPAAVDRSVSATLALARPRLAAAGAESDAELLLADALGWPRSRVIRDAGAPVPEEARQRYVQLVAERARGVPVAYLRGRKEFWSLELEVGPDVLVPRPETELLVELALAAIVGVDAPRVADLGTGSGAIGLAIASERADATVVLVEASAGAAAVARRNAAALGQPGVSVLEGDWFAPLPAGAAFDAIVANPPYLAADDPHLEGPGLAHEPRAALVSGATGLESLAAIAAAAGAYLRPGGHLYLEHGADQGPAVRGLLARAGFVAVTTARDLAGHERVTGGRVTG